MRLKRNVHWTAVVGRCFRQSLLAAAVIFSFTAAVQAAVVDRIVAVVNDEIVTLSDLERAFEPYKGKFEATYQGNDPKKALHEAKNEILNHIVDNMLMEQEAKRTGISVLPAEVEEAIADMLKSRKLSQEELLKVLARENLTMDAYKKDIREQLIRMKLIGRDIKAKVVATDEEIGAYYLNHREDYDGRESVRIRQIFLPTAEDATAEEKARTRAEAQSIHARLLAGEPFEALCMKFSKGPGAEEGGDIGYIEKGTILPEIESVAFALPLHRISDVIESPAGVHIIQATDRRGAGAKSIEAVREEIKAKIDREKTEKKYGEWLKKLREKSSVEIRY